MREVFIVLGLMIVAPLCVPLLVKVNAEIERQKMSGFYRELHDGVELSAAITNEDRRRFVFPHVVDLPFDDVEYRGTNTIAANGRQPLETPESCTQPQSFYEEWRPLQSDTK